MRHSLAAALAGILLVLGIAAAAGAEQAARKIVVCYDANCPPVSFGAGELCAALRAVGFEVSTASLADANTPVGAGRIVLATVADKPAAAGDLPPVDDAPESYAVSIKADQPLLVIGRDTTGAMYAAMDLAEYIRMGKALPRPQLLPGRAAIARRGVKFNIPLDARTPSYDDTGDSAQANIANMWDFEFWRAFLDDMARARYNALTLWSPHPFPSLVKCPDYPDVALADVCVTTLPLDRRVDREWGDRRHMRPENLKVVRKMTIDEKIAFWRRVMAYAKDRGIGVYIITWNVYVDAAAGKYGIDDKQDNPRTIAYMRQCVDQLIRTYPLLTGIGTTAGEHMQNRKDEFSKEKWLWATYGLGVMDAKKADPNRRVPFIHRVWQTDVRPLVDDFASKYPDTVELSFKYAKAHMYSSPRPPFARELLAAIGDRRLKCWWNLRNDDIFVFRWGDPGYVRSFLSNLPPAKNTAGYYVGSDGYVWGRTFNDVDPARRGRMEVEKHWYSFTLWGRMGYNLRTFPGPGSAPALLANRFDIKNDQAEALGSAWSSASAIIPMVNRFHWRDWDFQWAPEGCMDGGKGFHTVEDFIKTAPLEGRSIIPIPEYIEDPNHYGHSEAGESTPPIVARGLADCATRARNGVANVRKAGPVTNVELVETLADIEAMAHLGDYYAEKILAATDLAMYRKTGEAKFKASAVAHLEKAAAAAQAYADNASKRYRPQLLARTRELDFQALAAEAKKEVETVRQAK